MKLFDHIRWLVPAAIVAAVAVMVSGTGSAGAVSSATNTSSAPNVGQALGGASGVVGGLSGSVGSNGAYAQDNPKASSVPFLGGSPGSLLSGLFGALGPL